MGSEGLQGFAWSKEGSGGLSKGKALTNSPRWRSRINIGPAEYRENSRVESSGQRMVGRWGLWAEQDRDSPLADGP